MSVNRLPESIAGSVRQKLKHENFRRVVLLCMPTEDRKNSSSAIYDFFQFIATLFACFVDLEALLFPVKLSRQSTPVMASRPKMYGLGHERCGLDLELSTRFGPSLVS